MRKCPDCAEENGLESLFCKHCGRCLLAPDPEVLKWAPASHTENHEKIEGIDSYDGHIVKNSRVAKQKLRHRTGLSVSRGWLLLMNFLVVILLSEMIVILLSK